MTKHIFATIGQRKIFLLSLLLFGGLFLTSFITSYARERQANPDASPRDVLIDTLRANNRPAPEHRAIPTPRVRPTDSVLPTPTGSLSQTPTPSPNVEPTPSGESIEPYAGAPACEDIGIEHDARAWHGIWNPQYGCHWDHEHKRNPL